MSSIKCHFCQGEKCFNKSISHFCFSKTGKCFISVDLTNEEITHQRGCVDNELFCLHNRGQHLSNNKDAYLKCCDTEFCNGEGFLVFHNDQSSLEFNDPMQILPIILIAITLIIICCFLKKFIYRKKSHFNSNPFDLDEKSYMNIDYKTEVKVASPVDISHNVLDDCTSGSGSGIPLLIQRTFAKQISLIECVGKGRYGEVWKGLFQYEEVAVKIFFSRDEASFQREIEIYTNNLHKQENILTFIGSDVTSKNSCTQLWLVTAYHELGSLFDYLNHHSINLDSMFSIMTSIASGITYLHTENFGTQKPAIAHRDIKSKNILMKSKNVCCIADFGLAVTKQKTGSLNIVCNYRVGTKRYMAPEVLAGTFIDTNFDSYTNADIYSFSLVLWEIIRRLESDTQSALNYEVPYQHKVPSDPSFEDMRRVVCIEHYRPEIPKELENHRQISLGPICNIIQESWSKNPYSRLSALRIKKSLINLMNSSKTC